MSVFSTLKKAIHIVRTELKMANYTTGHKYVCGSDGDSRSNVCISLRRATGFRFQSLNLPLPPKKNFPTRGNRQQLTLSGIEDRRLGNSTVLHLTPPRRNVASVRPPESTTSLLTGPCFYPSDIRASADGTSSVSV